MTLALLITAVTGAWAEDTYTVAGNNSAMFGSVWDADYTANDMTKNGDGTYSITYTNVNFTENEEVQYKVVKNHSWNEAYPADGNRAINIAEAGTYTLTIHFNPTTHEVYETMPGSEPAAIDVTTNAASEQDLFTEASFAMPPFDVDVNYELVRDMSVQMTTTMGDGTDGVRYRVKKAQQGQGYEPADMNMVQVLALVAVNDAIEQKDLTLDQDYFCRIYKLDEQTLQPEGDGVKLADFDFAPGLYALKAFAQDDSDYAGETALSNTFKLFQGYEVEIAAQSFATYYSDDEALTLDETFAETAGLYTVSEVTATEAVLSEKIDVMPKRTPMLIYNESETLQTVLLIPTADVAPLTDVAAEFKGTAVEKTVSAEEVAATNFYVLTDQNQFVWVKDAGTIAAHRCWLEIAPSQAQAARRIVFSGSGTTGVESLTPTLSEGEGDWYDLNGRKINIPTKKGIYIQNGKKVVVK